MAISIQNMRPRHKVGRNATVSTSNLIIKHPDSPKYSDIYLPDSHLNRKVRKRKIQPIPSSVFDEGTSLNDESRIKFIIRNTPVEDSRYIDVWHRAKLRLKIQYMLQKLLYGSRGGKRKVTINWDQEYAHHENNSNQYRGIGYEAINIEPAANDEIPFLIIHPNSKVKGYLNIVTAFLLIYTATIMPFSLAFIDSKPYDAWFVFDLVIDFLFFMDVFVNCITAYYDSEGQLITSHCRIFLSYFKSWMIVDIIACFPFGYLEESDTNTDHGTRNSYNNIVRLARLPKLYRLLRVFKAFKHYRNSELAEKIQDFLRIKHSAMRLCSSVTTILICLHIATCFWYYSAKLDGFGPDTWVVREGYIDDDMGTVYITSLYWALTTFCTVGYGDINAKTVLEKLIAMIWMIFGLFFFSFTISSLSSMLANIDSK